MARCWTWTATLTAVSGASTPDARIGTWTTDPGGTGIDAVAWNVNERFGRSEDTREFIPFLAARPRGGAALSATRIQRSDCS